MAEVMSVPAPAKVNLFLRITGRRSDGYHNLQTWFQLLDYGDELTFAVRDDGEIRTRIEYADDCFEAIVNAQDNSVVRAAAVLRQRCPDRAAGADILLCKRVPIGAGLGGGSSDAATALCVFNQLWGCGLSKGELLELGRELGADVPVFVNGETAWAEGVGDQLVSAPLPEAWYSILVPQTGLSTAEMFQLPELERSCSPVTRHDYHSGQADNVFEPLVRKHCPQAGAALDWLAQYGKARLTGSGSGVFAAFPDPVQAAAVIEKKPAYLFGCVAKGLNQSPLGGVLKKIF